MGDDVGIAIEPASVATAVNISEIDMLVQEYKVPMENLYRSAVKFYREMESNGEYVIPYDVRLKFMAYSKQVKYGSFTEDAADAGFFDFTGSDRQKAWKELGDLSRQDAMSGFAFLLDRVCPPFRDFVHEQLENERRAAAITETNSNDQVPHSNSSDSSSGNNNSSPKDQIQLSEVLNAGSSQQDIERFESQRRQIQEALNKQTYNQFLVYAQQHFKDNVEQQQQLIKQLQEQHYQQYMAQVYAQQARGQGMTPDGNAVPVNGPQDPEAGSPTGGSSAHPSDPNLAGQMAKLKVTNEKDQNGDDTDVSDEEPGDDLPSNPAISPASMWTRQDCVDFKNEIKKVGEGIIKVGHGETVTVRVPTHEDGSSLFWEFATDYYDIGFGVLFEWTVSDTNEVSITVSESSDEEELDEEGLAQETGEGAGDIESGARSRRRDPNKPHIDEIMPVYRRDSHESVYAGSHKYPGVGVYLLKFDNSYSLWRSKTLYYRVFYTKMEKQPPIPFKCGLANTICDVLNQRPGWTPAKGEEWLFNWVTRDWMVSSFDHYPFRERQVVCHYRNDFELTRKDCLIKNFKKAKKNAKNPEELNFLPASYVVPTEYHLFVEEFRKYPPDTVWIMKPVSGAQGKGIFLFRKLKEITDWRRKDIGSAMETQPYVVQKYIDSPNLIGGKKYDIRIYVLVTSFRPLNAWVHREGFARFSHSRYSMSSVEDAYVHLTNVAIAKSAPDFDAERGLKWNLFKWKRYLTAVSGQEKTRKVMEDIATIIMESLRFVNGMIIQNKHCFELFGYDILLDSTLKPWLLEVNASPSLTASSQEDYEMKFRVLNDMLDVVDLENRLSGQETRVGGFDLLLRNNEPVLTSASGDPNRKPTFFTPSLNIRLGASTDPPTSPSA